MPTHMHPYLLWFTCEDRSIFNGLVYPGTVSRSSQDPPRAQSPFARSRCYLFRRIVSYITSEGVAPPSSLLWTHATDQNPPADFSSLYTASLCRLLSVPAGSWSFPTLYLKSLHGCLDPYPGVLLRCFCPFLPEELQPHKRCTKFGTPNYRRNATSTTTPFSRRQSFRYVQAPMLASPPDGTYRVGTKSYGQPGRLHHAMDWKLPSRTVVSLHDRIGQLSWRDFHPLDFSLVGRSLQHWGLL
jgi:hypothetical protein